MVALMGATKVFAMDDLKVSSKGCLLVAMRAVSKVDMKVVLMVMTMAYKLVVLKADLMVS